MTASDILLQAAGKIFAEKGFESATVREICTEANVNVAAVSYHFGDKERLYVAAVKYARDLLEAAVPMPVAANVGAPEERLAHFIQTLTRRMLNHDAESWQHRLLIREFTEPSRACEEMMEETILPFMAQLHDVLRQLLPSDVPHYTVEQLGFSVISQCAYYRFQERMVAMLISPSEYAQHYSPEQLAEHITRFSIAAIRAYHSIDSIP